MTRWGLSAAGCLLLAAMGAASGMSRAASRPQEQGEGPSLLIAAERVSGFVPFTVTVYGRVRGVEPGSIEFCRLRIPSPFEPQNERPPSRSGPDAEAVPETSEPAACVTGRAVASAGWLAYEHDLRFDRAGQYQVRLTMIDNSGRRLTSNTVRVSAF